MTQLSRHNLALDERTVQSCESSYGVNAGEDGGVRPLVDRGHRKAYEASCSWCEDQRRDRISSRRPALLVARYLRYAAEVQSGDQRGGVLCPGQPSSAAPCTGGSGVEAAVSRSRVYLHEPLMPGQRPTVPVSGCTDRCLSICRSWGRPLSRNLQGNWQGAGAACRSRLGYP